MTSNALPFQVCGKRAGIDARRSARERGTDLDGMICGLGTGHPRACGEWTLSTEKAFIPDLDRPIPEAVAAVHDPGDRFSEDTLGRDGKAFIAVAMESTETHVHVAPFSVTIEVEAARSKLTLSFEHPNAALIWITNLRDSIMGNLHRIDAGKLNREGE